MALFDFILASISPTKTPLSRPNTPPLPRSHAQSLEWEEGGSRLRPGTPRRPTGPTPEGVEIINVDELSAADVARQPRPMPRRKHIPEQPSNAALQHQPSKPALRVPKRTPGPAPSLKPVPSSSREPTQMGQISKPQFPVPVSELSPALKINERASMPALQPPPGSVATPSPKSVAGSSKAATPQASTSAAGSASSTMAGRIHLFRSLLKTTFSPEEEAIYDLLVRRYRGQRLLQKSLQKERATPVAFDKEADLELQAYIQFLYKYMQKHKGKLPSQLLALAPTPHKPRNAQPEATLASTQEGSSNVPTAPNSPNGEVANNDLPAVLPPPPVQPQLLQKEEPKRRKLIVKPRNDHLERYNFHSRMDPMSSDSEEELPDLDNTPYQYPPTNPEDPEWLKVMMMMLEEERTEVQQHLNRLRAALHMMTYEVNAARCEAAVEKSNTIAMLHTIKEIVGRDYFLLLLSAKNNLEDEDESDIEYDLGPEEEETHAETNSHDGPDGGQGNTSNDTNNDNHLTGAGDGGHHDDNDGHDGDLAPILGPLVSLPEGDLHVEARPTAQDLDLVTLSPDNTPHADSGRELRAEALSVAPENTQPADSARAPRNERTPLQPSGLAPGRSTLRAAGPSKFHFQFHNNYRDPAPAISSPPSSDEDDEDVPRRPKPAPKKRGRPAAVARDEDECLADDESNKRRRLFAGPAAAAQLRPPNLDSRLPRPLPGAHSTNAAQEVPGDAAGKNGHDEGEGGRHIDHDARFPPRRARSPSPFDDDPELAIPRDGHRTHFRPKSPPSKPGAGKATRPYNYDDSDEELAIPKPRQPLRVPQINKASQKASSDAVEKKGVKEDHVEPPRQKRRTRPGSDSDEGLALDHNIVPRIKTKNAKPVPPEASHKEPVLPKIDKGKRRADWKEREAEQARKRPSSPVNDDRRHGLAKRRKLMPLAQEDGENDPAETFSPPRHEPTSLDGMKRSPTGIVAVPISPAARPPRSLGFSSEENAKTPVIDRSSNEQIALPTSPGAPTGDSAGPALPKTPYRSIFHMDSSSIKRLPLEFQKRLAYGFFPPPEYGGSAPTNPETAQPTAEISRRDSSSWTSKKLVQSPPRKLTRAQLMMQGLNGSLPGAVMVPMPATRPPEKRGRSVLQAKAKAPGHVPVEARAATPQGSHANTVIDDEVPFQNFDTQWQDEDSFRSLPFL